MKLTHEQTNAYDLIHRWLKDPSPSSWDFFLSGYAGTGKTTLLQHFINSLDKPPVCNAPTGKAASVLKKKLPPDVIVKTTHSTLYRAVPASTAELMRLEAEFLKNPTNETLKEAMKAERAKLARSRLSFTNKEKPAIGPGTLAVVDECSMVTARMANDYRNTGAKVLFVGDTGQIPPVGDTGVFLKRKPDASLTEVQRNAGPIAHLGARIREGQSIPEKFKEVDERGRIERMPTKSFMPNGYKEHDQIITGTNRTRMNLNRHMRRILGFKGDMPNVGERLICLKNETGEEGRGFINGVQAICTVAPEWNEELGDWLMGINYDGQDFPSVAIYAHPFQVYSKPDAEELPFPMRTTLAEFDFGYCITGHKSQGSEWGSVVLVDDGFNRGDAVFRRRWLYTAVTRAKERLTWVTM